MKENNGLAFGKQNYVWMLIGIVLLVVGFFVMTLDGEPHGFGFVGLTLGPTIVFVGFMVEIYAIFIKKS
ncbi:DUF3098 domain-containing protein [Fulvitalea axinellae]